MSSVELGNSCQTKFFHQNTKNGYLGQTKHRMNLCQICQIVLVRKENKQKTKHISKQNILTWIQNNFVLNFASVLFKKVKTPTKQSVV